MRELQFEIVAKNLLASDIEEFERKIDKKLPDEIIQFYLNNNGGVPVEYIYWKDDDVYVVDLILPIKYEVGDFEGLTLEEIYERFLDVIPDSYLPIMCVDGSLFFVVSLAEEDYGYIYLWNTEYEYEEEYIEEFMAHITLLGKNLSEVLEYFTDKHPE